MPRPLKRYRAATGGKSTVSNTSPYRSMKVAKYMRWPVCVWVFFTVTR